MAIQPRGNIDPTQMSNNWLTGVTNNAPKWEAGVLSPRRMFNANPAAAQTAFAAGVNRAVAANSYANGLKNTDLTAMANNISTNGQGRYTSGATAKQAKYLKAATKVAPMINSALSSIANMPRGTLQQNLARATAFATAMAQNKGKGKALAS
jgi:hypothetical protein